MNIRTIALTATIAVAGIVCWITNPSTVRAQQKDGRVALNFTLTDIRGRYVRGLDPKEFQILEDGIVQKIASFADGSRPPVEVLDNGTTRPLDSETWQKQVDGLPSISEDPDNAYTVTYYPQPNPNQGFRKITIVVTSDALKRYRVRSKPGYTPSR